MIDLDRSIDTQVVVACEDATANHDNTYDVTVLATSGALSDTQLLHVAVQNVSGATITGGKKSETVDATHAMKGQFATLEPDAIGLKHSKFKAIGTSLSSDEFYAHSKAHAAHDKSDRIIYDTKHGKLYYDADGKGGHDAVQFAALSDHPALDAGNFLIV